MTAPLKWVDFAKAEIATWPTTEGLGMTVRTEVILNDFRRRRSVLDAPSPGKDLQPTE